MSIMRWNVYNGLKQSLDIPVHLTYGYLTKHMRIAHGLEKTHAIDARCISGNATATPCETEFHFRQLRRHNRKVMKSNLLKGGRWKRNQAPREIKGFRLFDTVSYKNLPAYIHGRRSSGYFVIKDAEGRTLSNSASYKSLWLVRHNNQMFYYIKRIGSIPPTNEFVGFLEQLS